MTRATFQSINPIVSFPCSHLRSDGQLIYSHADGSNTKTLCFFFFFFATSSSRWRSQVPDQGSNASRLHWKRGVLTTGLPRKPCSTFISNTFIQVNSCYLEHHLPAPQCSPYNIHCPSPSPRSLVFPSKTCPSTLASVCSSTGA